MSFKQLNFHILPKKNSENSCQNSEEKTRMHLCGISSVQVGGEYWYKAP